MLFTTAYLPPISFFRAILTEKDSVYIEAYENYQKRSIRNRTYISGANKIIHLSVPLTQGKNSQLPIQSVEISYDEDWVQHHLENIYTCYSQSAFFEHYIGGIESILLARPKYLFELNLSLLKHILPILSINSTLLLTNDYQKHNNISLKDKFINIPLRTKQEISKLNQAYYPQVFEDRYGFIPELSILDLIFCMGPEAEWIIGNK